VTVVALASCQCTAAFGTPLCRRRQLLDWLHKATTWQTYDWSQHMLISLTAYAHFGARLGACFYWTRCFENNVPFDNTTPIYLINLLWKLELRI